MFLPDVLIYFAIECNGAVLLNSCFYFSVRVFCKRMITILYNWSEKLFLSFDDDFSSFFVYFFSPSSLTHSWIKKYNLETVLLQRLKSMFFLKIVGKSQRDLWSEVKFMQQLDTIIIALFFSLFLAHCASDCWLPLFSIFGVTNSLHLVPLNLLYHHKIPILLNIFCSVEKGNLAYLYVCRYNIKMNIFQFYFFAGSS